jgi:hypothetical protein
MIPSETYTLHATWDGEVYVEDHLGRAWRVDRILVYPAQIHVQDEDKTVLVFERGDDDSRLYTEGGRFGQAN